MRRWGVRFTAFSTPTIIATLGPYTSASISPTRHPSACIASARFTATVDLPTTTLAAGDRDDMLDAGDGARLRHSCRRSRRGGRRLFNLNFDRGHTRHRRDRSLHFGHNFLDDFGFRRRRGGCTVTAAEATSISLSIPNDTMSRVKPGYFWLL